jgi:TetR/AcrR family transcriptional regulator
MLLKRALRHGNGRRTPDDMNAPLPKSSIREVNERAILSAAESVFAERGYSGATMSMIAARAGSPKANIHYYFPTKEGLYRAVIGQVLTAWLDAAASFDTSDDPVEALTAYIGAKMDLAREMPLSSQIYASEIMRGAPVIQDFLDTTLSGWVRSREVVVRRWIAEGKLRPIEPKYLFYMIWATTQHYANATHEMATLEGGAPLGEAAFERAKRQAAETVLFGVAAAERTKGFYAAPRRYGLADDAS